MTDAHGAPTYLRTCLSYVRGGGGQVRTGKLDVMLSRALCVVLWLQVVSTVSDGTCRLVCEMFDVPTLVALMEVGFGSILFGSVR